jgi:hypothetical protein
MLKSSGQRQPLIDAACIAQTLITKLSFSQEIQYFTQRIIFILDPQTFWRDRALSR